MTDCPWCGGCGEVPVVFGAKTLSFPDGVVEFAPCTPCTGSGVVPVWFALALTEERNPA